MKKDKQFNLALGLSLLIHLLILSGFSYQSATEDKEELIQVKLFTPDEQIVPDSDSKEVETPPETNKLSGKNTIARIEQIKRGVEDGGIQNPKTVQIEPKPKQEEAKSETKKSPDLLLDQNKLQSRFNKTKKTQEKTSEQRTKEFESTKPFRRSLKPLGSSAYLPEIPDGDITLLNSKADRNAVFVRRVALQVFGAIRKRHWATLSASEISSIQQGAKIHAIMSAEGDLLKAFIETPSGSKNFDQIVKDAASEGTWDKNPPEKAKTPDGNIHFIFQARTWARFVGDNRTEKRWLLLGTGLL